MQSNSPCLVFLLHLHAKLNSSSADATSSMQYVGLLVTMLPV
jgi:hypothetical protein